MVKWRFTANNNTNSKSIHTLWCDANLHQLIPSYSPICRKSRRAIRHNDVDDTTKALQPLFDIGRMHQHRPKMHITPTDDRSILCIQFIPC